MKKAQLLKAMKAAGIEGEVTGRGADVEVELANEDVKDEFCAKVVNWGGFRTGYGAWILRPGYVCGGDWNDTSSRHHY